MAVQQLKEEILFWFLNFIENLFLVSKILKVCFVSKLLESSYFIPKLLKLYYFCHYALKNIFCPP